MGGLPGSLDQFYPCALLLTKLIKLEVVGRKLDRSPGYIHPEDSLELPIGEDMTHEFALTAPGIDDAGCPNSSQNRENCADSLLVKSQRTLDLLLLLVDDADDGVILRGAPSVNGAAKGG